MTQQTIEAFQQLDSAIILVNSTLRMVTSCLEEVRRKLKIECDHKMPDGKSAVTDGFLFSSCSICNANNL